LAEQLSIFIEKPFRIEKSGKRIEQIMHLIDSEPGIEMSKIAQLLCTSADAVKQYNQAIKGYGYKTIRVYPRGVKYFPPNYKEE